MKIGIDLMGGDNSELIVEAVNNFVKDNKGDTIVVFSTENNDNLSKLDGNVQVVKCKTEVEKDDDPAFVVRTKKDSTLVVGSQALKDNEVDAFISAGNTGALVACGLFVIKRLESVSKPALPGFLQRTSATTPVMLLDLGATLNPNLDNMKEFASVATLYMKNFYNVDNPSIKLLNNGIEENKGIDLYKELHEDLKNDKSFNFQGNIEPRDVLDADCDIILMDGWTGNILLKSIEGTVGFLGKNIKKTFYASPLNKIAGLIIKKDMKKMYDKLDYRELGATPVLGVNGLLLKAHGSSNEVAFYNALMQAKKLYDDKFLDSIK